MKYLAIFILLTILISCGSKKILTKYYTLDSCSAMADTIQLRQKNVPIPNSVYIQKIGVAGPYNDNTIALRTETNELQYYVYHKWAEKPATATRRFIWQTLKSQNIFIACDISLYQLTPDFEITGYISLIERVSVGETYAAHLKMTLELKKSENLKLLLTYSFDRTIPIKESTGMNQFAAGISRILEEELQVFIIQIQNHFNK